MNDDDFRKQVAQQELRRNRPNALKIEAIRLMCVRLENDGVGHGLAGMLRRAVESPSDADQIFLSALDEFYGKAEGAIGRGKAWEEEAAISLGLHRFAFAV